jgi:hypothetical protein
MNYSIPHLIYDDIFFIEGVKRGRYAQNRPKWNETLEFLLRKAIESLSKLVRELFFSLYLVASGLSATQAAKRVGKASQTVAEWIDRFNLKGAEGLFLVGGVIPGRGLLRRN